MNYRMIIAEVEDHVRAGRARDAVVTLTRLNTNQVPRDFRLSLANLCRRLGLIGQGLRLLSPVVRPTQGSRLAAATPSEQAEYAVLLVRGGADQEAARILEDIDPTAAPESLLYRSFIFFNRWEHGSAEPLLRQYIQSDLSDYARAVGLLNLSAALLGSDQHTKALETVLELRDLAESSGWGRILGNCYEQLGQIDIERGQFNSGLSHLEKSSQLLRHMATRDEFFVRKWKAVAEARMGGGVEPLAELRIEAERQLDWETVRECDRHSLRIRFNADLFKQLIFGTPHFRYRQRVCEELKREVGESDYYWGEPGGPILDMISGLAEVKRPQRSGKILELVEVLSRDFYKPFTLGALFSAVYSDEYFDIHTSPGRVRQLLTRTRKYLKMKSIPLGIVEHRGGYRLKAFGPVQIRVALHRRSVGGYSFQLQFLARCTGEQPLFTAQQARQWLGMKRTTFQRFIAWAEAERHICRVGEGAQTKYSLQSEIQKAA